MIWVERANFYDTTTEYWNDWGFFLNDHEKPFFAFPDNIEAESMIAYVLERFDHVIGYHHNDVALVMKLMNEFVEEGCKTNWRIE